MITKHGDVRENRKGKIRIDKSQTQSTLGTRRRKKREKTNSKVNYDEHHEHHQHVLNYFDVIFWCYNYLD
jgi:hypothetical protein